MWTGKEFGELAREAGELGLALSGMHREAGDSDNGIRLFSLSPGGYVDHHRGDHIGHCDTVSEVRSFLQGYRQGIARSTKPAATVGS
jgi:hypothetical protein